MSRGVVLLLTVMTVALMMVASQAWADATFIVNSTGDGGDVAPRGVCNTAPFQQGTEPECTLRAAIQEANATTAADNINFSIGGSGVKTISPSTSLPTITQPVTIDGYTEPGASKNTLAVGDNAVLLIRLDGGSNIDGRGLGIDTNDSVVRGLSITGFSDTSFSDGVGLAVSGDRNTVEGNFIGTDPGGTLTGAGNSGGVSVQDDSSNNLVGGSLPEARNVISGNGRGVYISTDLLEGENRVQGNYIGTTKSGTGDLGNRFAGVTDNSFGDTRNLIGGATRASANTIAFNGTGVRVGVNSDPDPVGTSILSNSIFSNDGPGIDLDGDGITPNDGPGDADTGPNNLQNFPVITRATTSRSTGRSVVRGTLNSTPTTTFTIQLFVNSAADPSGFGEGQRLARTLSVRTDAVGNASFGLKARKFRGFISATATNDATGDTSEFSMAKKVMRTR